MLRKFLFCVLMTVLAYVPLKAQDVPYSTDTELWMSFSLEKKINKKFSTSLDQQVRLESHFSQFKRYLIEPSVQMEVVDKLLDAEALYRLSFEQDGLKHRLGTSLTFSQKVSDLTIRLRSGYQIEFDNTEFIESLGIESNWRNKLDARWRINKRWSIYANTEWFYHISYLPNDWKRYRLQTGLRYGRKRNNFKVFYMMQQQINVAMPERTHVFGVKYGFELDD